MSTNPLGQGFAHLSGGPLPPRLKIAQHGRPADRFNVNTCTLESSLCGQPPYWRQGVLLGRPIADCSFHHSNFRTQQQSRGHRLSRNWRLSLPFVTAVTVTRAIALQAQKPATARPFYCCCRRRGRRTPHRRPRIANRAPAPATQKKAVWWIPQWWK